MEVRFQNFQFAGMTQNIAGTEFALAHSGLRRHRIRPYRTVSRTIAGRKNTWQRFTTQANLTKSVCG